LKGSKSRTIELSKRSSISSSQTKKIKEYWNVYKGFNRDLEKTTDDCDHLSNNMNIQNNERRREGIIYIFESLYGSPAKKLW